MGLFKVINSFKVIDKFGRKVITFKSAAAAAKFVDTNGKEYDPSEIDSIADATDEDRAAAGLVLDDGIPGLDSKTADETAEKLQIRRIGIRLHAQIVEVNPNFDASKLKW